MEKKYFLGELVNIDSGFAFKSSLFTDDNQYIPIIRIRDVNSGEASTYYSGEYDEKYIVNKGDLLISMDGSFVVKKWNSKKALLNQRVCRIKSISDKITDEYLYRILPRELKAIEDKTPFVTVKHLSVKSIENIEIKLPSLEKQKKIVEVLDKAQSLIDKKREQIDLLDELVKARFVEMFGDPFKNEKNFEMSKLGEVTIVNPKKSEIKELDDELNISFVSMEKVGTKGEFDSKNSKTIKEVYKGFTYFRNNDVLFAKITPCMENGKGAIATNLINDIGFGSTEFHVIRPIIRKSNPYWIYHLSTLVKFRKLAERNMTGSAGQKRVSSDFISNLKVVVPPIELQNEFAEFVTQTDSIRSKMEASLSELEDNFNSLMQKAFKGELF